MDAQDGGAAAANPGLPVNFTHEFQHLAAAVKALQGGVRQGWLPGGFLGGVVCGCLLFTALGAAAWYRHRYSIRRLFERQQQREAVRQLSSLDAGELHRLLGGVNLPSWVTYPDHQRVQWLTTLLHQLWPFAAKAAAAWAEQEVPGMLEANKPSWMRSIKLHHFSMGPVPPEPLGVKVYSEEESRNEEAVVDFDFSWTGEQQVSFVVKPVPRSATHAVTRLPVLAQLVDALSNLVVIKAAVERMTMHGRLRLTLRPLMSQLPLVGAAQIAFTELPKFSFDLSVYGGDVSVLPGLETWLHGLIQDAVLRPFVLPEKMIIPLADNVAPDFEPPRGLLQVRVCEAEHVPRMDLLSKTDPFVVLSVREKNRVKTQVLDNTHRPVWDEDFSLLVHYPDTQVLTARMYDYDAFDQNDEIGRAEVALHDLPRGREVDSWLTVEPPHQEGKPASQKYHVTAGQKAVGALIRPWDTAKMLGGGRRKGKRECRLHLKLTFLEFKEEEVEAALSMHHHRQLGRSGDSAMEGELSHASPAVRKALQGGVLVLRVLRAESLAGKPLLLGGWKRNVQVDVWFAGKLKRTLPVKGRGEQHNIDQELEFVVGGDAVSERHHLELEVWDTHWRKAFQGRASVPFQSIRYSKLWRQTLDLKEVAQGRISLEAQWMPAFAT